MRGRIHTANDDGFPVSYPYLGIDLVLADRRHIVQGIDEIRLVLGHLDRHDHLAVRRNLRSDLQRQRSLAECNRGSATLRGLLVRDFGAFEDAGGFLIGGDHLGLGDDFTIAGLLHGAEFKVQQHAPTQHPQANAGTGPFHPKIDKHVLAQNSSFAVEPRAPAHPKAFLVIDIGLDDARLDLYLPYRHIQLRHQLAQLGKPLLRLVRHQRIGAHIHIQTTAPRQNAVIGQRGQQQFGKL
ncbi:hypothetical protein D3C78_587270 [compost metagenome]